MDNEQTMHMNIIYRPTMGLLRLSQVFWAVLTGKLAQWTQTFPFKHPDANRQFLHRQEQELNGVVGSSTNIMIGFSWLELQ